MMFKGLLIDFRYKKNNDLFNDTGCNLDYFILSFNKINDLEYIFTDYR